MAWAELVLPGQYALVGLYLLKVGRRYYIVEVVYPETRAPGHYIPPEPRALGQPVDPVLDQQAGAKGYCEGYVALARCSASASPSAPSE